jgi:hypothetical protein
MDQSLPQAALVLDLLALLWLYPDYLDKRTDNHAWIFLIAATGFCPDRSLDLNTYAFPCGFSLLQEAPLGSFKLKVSSSKSKLAVGSRQLSKKSKKTKD